MISLIVLALGIVVRPLVLDITPMNFRTPTTTQGSCQSLTALQLIHYFEVVLFRVLLNLFTIFHFPIQVARILGLPLSV